MLNPCKALCEQRAIRLNISMFIIPTRCLKMFLLARQRGRVSLLEISRVATLRQLQPKLATLKTPFDDMIIPSEVPTRLNILISLVLLL